MHKIANPSTPTIKIHTYVSYTYLKVVVMAIMMICCIFNFLIHMFLCDFVLNPWNLLLSIKTKRGNVELHKQSNTNPTTQITYLFHKAMNLLVKWTELQLKHQNHIVMKYCKIYIIHIEISINYTQHTIEFIFFLNTLLKNQVRSWTSYLRFIFSATKRKILET